jgi:hypothetical protein
LVSLHRVRRVFETSSDISFSDELVRTELPPFLLPPRYVELRIKSPVGEGRQERTLNSLADQSFRSVLWLYWWMLLELVLQQYEGVIFHKSQKMIHSSEYYVRSVSHPTRGII